MLRLLMLLAVFCFASCASNRVASTDPELVNEVMITFVTKARAGFWREAMENVTPEERDEMMDGNGQVMQEYKEAVGRIRLSTVKNMKLGLDSKKRLVGLLDVLDGSNEFYRASDDVIVIDPSKLEDLSIRRKKQEEEEAKLKFEEEKTEAAEESETPLSDPPEPESEFEY